VAWGEKRSLEALKLERETRPNRFDAHGWWLPSVQWRDYPHQIMPVCASHQGPPEIQMLIYSNPLPEYVFPNIILCHDDYRISIDFPKMSTRMSHAA
jgi:hypothetical protein